MTDRLVLPAELAHHPHGDISIEQYVAWRERRRAWFTQRGLLPGRRSLDWAGVRCAAHD